MAPRWETSAEKHGLSRGDIIFAILNATYAAEVVGEVPTAGRIMVFIGPQHAQTDREIEVLVHEYPETDREAVIFHAMPLGAKFRTHREEHPA